MQRIDVCGHMYNCVFKAIESNEIKIDVIAHLAVSAILNFKMGAFQTFDIGEVGTTNHHGCPNSDPPIIHQKCLVQLGSTVVARLCKT